MLNEMELRLLPKLEPVEARFWSKVAIVDDDHSCWEWQAATVSDGYGGFSWRHAPHPLLTGLSGAHRVAFYLINGFVPEHTCHTCDNPPCVRPSHLFAGTVQENIADRHAKGRSKGSVQIGEANHNTKLTEEAVLAIRTAVAAGEPEVAVADRYGISRPAVTLIRQGATWAHVGGPTSATGTRRSKLTDEQVDEIRSRTERGSVLAAEYGVSPSLISKIRQGHHR